MPGISNAEVLMGMNQNSIDHCAREVQPALEGEHALCTIRFQTESLLPLSRTRNMLRLLRTEWARGGKLLGCCASLVGWAEESPYSTVVYLSRRFTDGRDASL